MPRRKHSTTLTKPVAPGSPCEALPGHFGWLGTRASIQSFHLGCSTGSTQFFSVPGGWSCANGAFAFVTIVGSGWQMVVDIDWYWWMVVDIGWYWVISMTAFNKPFILGVSNGLRNPHMKHGWSLSASELVYHLVLLLDWWRWMQGPQAGCVWPWDCSRPWGMQVTPIIRW